MTICRYKSCPYHSENNFCLKRVPVVNQYGLCGYRFIGSSPRDINRVYTQHLEKREMTLIQWKEEAQDQSREDPNEAAANEQKTKEGSSKETAGV